LARLVLISNRVAIPGREGGAQAGGLAVAIHSVMQRHPGIWLGWSGEIATKSNTKVRTIQRGHLSYVMTDLIEEDYREYYNGYANRVLWPILHCRLDLAELSRRDLTG
jgi:trehalose 6-phosphate synthase